MSVIIQLKGGTAAKWQEVNPTLAEREMGIETDTHNYKIGDGFTSWNSLEYSSFPQNAEDGGNKVTTFDNPTDIQYPSAKLVYEQLEEKSINIKSFGAKGDGITDDTVAIQNAINQASGKILFFPVGDYLYKDDINSIPNVHWLGAGLDTKLICGAFRKGIYLNDNCIFEGFYVEGNRTILGADDQTMNTNVHPSGDNIQIKNNYFHDAIGSCISTSGSTHINISKNIFNTWTDHAVYFSTSSTDLQINDNFFLGELVGVEAIKLREGCSHVVISNNIATNVSCFMYVSAETIPCKDIIISNNYATTKAHSILFGRLVASSLHENIIIKGNIFENYNLPTSYTAISLSWTSLVGVKNIEIEGNIFKNYKDLALKGESADAIKLENMKFHNNSVIITTSVTFDSNMIKMYECTNCSFKDNYIKNENVPTSVFYIFDNAVIDIIGNIFDVTPTYFIDLNNSANVNINMFHNQIKCVRRMIVDGEITSGIIKIYNNKIVSNETTYPYIYDRNIVTNHYLYNIENNIVNGSPYYGNLSTMPTTGTWTKGRMIENSSPTILGDAGSKYIIKGWFRITTGSNNVLNTDWIEDRVLIGV